MGFLTRTITDENDGVAAFASNQIRQIATSLHGLTSEQIRSTPSASAMSLAAIARHVIFINAKGLLASLDPDHTPAPEAYTAQDHAAGGVQPEGILGEDTAESLIAELNSLADRTEQLLSKADLDRRIPVPDQPWFSKDLGTWPARWVALHTIEECARHAGHADIIRESIDGLGAYELNALAEGVAYA